MRGREEGGRGRDGGGGVEASGSWGEGAAAVGTAAAGRDMTTVVTSAPSFLWKRTGVVFPSLSVRTTVIVDGTDVVIVTVTVSMEKEEQPAGRKGGDAAGFRGEEEVGRGV